MDFNWNLKSDDFYFERITNRVNADKLFASLLIKIEEQGINIHKEFTLIEITELIPIGTAAINNKSTYGYSFMSMLSKQKNRDYYIFENETLGAEFSSASNNPLRDNFYWLRKYSSERLKINPKYIK